MGYWTREREDGLGVEGVTSAARPDGDGWVEVDADHPLRLVRGDELRLADGEITHVPGRRRAIAHLRAARASVEADKLESAEAEALEVAIADEQDPDVKAALEARRAK